MWTVLTRRRLRPPASCISLPGFADIRGATRCQALGLGVGGEVVGCAAGCRGPWLEVDVPGLRELGICCLALADWSCELRLLRGMATVRHVGPRAGGGDLAL